MNILENIATTKIVDPGPHLRVLTLQILDQHLAQHQILHILQLAAEVILEIEITVENLKIARNQQNIKKCYQELIVRQIIQNLK